MQPLLPCSSGNAALTGNSASAGLPKGLSAHGLRKARARRLADADRARYLAAFRQGFRETGYVEGQNVAIEYRWAEDQHNRLPDLAADLVRSQVAVIAAQDTTSAM